jgi:protein required for attachment to host cells
MERHLKNPARAAGKVLADTPAGRGLEENLAIIRDALGGLDAPRARGLAIFAGAARGLRRVLTLDFPVENQLVIDEEPHVLPLLERWYAEPSFLVATVDADEAHLFEVIHGPIDRVRDLVREDARQEYQRDKPRFIAKKRFAHTRHERLHGMADDRFLKEVAEALEKQWVGGHFDGLILLGQTQVTGPLRRMLGREIGEAVIGEEPHAMTRRAEDLAEETARLIDRFREAREAALLAELWERRQRDHLVATGPTDVLDALQQGRASRVFLGNGRDLPGARCLGCNYRLGGPVGVCPYCGELTRPVNALQEVMKMAMRHRVRVSICRRPSDKDDPIAPYGGVAALLIAPANWAPSATAAEASQGLARP